MLSIKGGGGGQMLESIWETLLLLIKKIAKKIYQWNLNNKINNENIYIL